MRRTTHVLIIGGLLILSYFSLSPSLSPLSSFDPRGALPTWIDDVYLQFDSLRTDLSDYRWPTDAGRKMSSGFASFRTMHFHAGIDLSTNGRTGYRVFASRGGFVSRIFVSPYGYGKMLHVRHPDGFTTVYAHLQRFNAEIDSFVREEQYRKETYSLDLTFEEETFPVAQGATIAYTGDTGVGPAHFHFEIRDEHMNPVNPLLAPEFAEAVADNRFPEFQQASFSPLDHAARVEGKAETAVLAVRNPRRNVFTFPRMIHLTGAIGISIKGSDQTNATWQRTNVYRYELFLDSTLLFTSTMDRFSAKETEQIALHYDWTLLKAGDGRYQKLFLEPGNQLPLYSRLPERSGVLVTSDFPPGEHEIRILATDIAGNTSELSGRVFFDDPPAIDVTMVEQKFVLTSPSTSPLRSISVASKTPGSGRWRTTTYDPSTLASAGDGYVLPVDPESPRLFKILARDDRGSQSYPVFFAPRDSRSSNTSLKITKEFIRDFVVVTVSSHLPFTLRPSVWLVDGEQRNLLDLHASDERTYFGTFPLKGIKGGAVRIEAGSMVNGTAVEGFDEFSIFPITPEEGGSIVAGEGEFMLDFKAHGVYQPLYCRVEKTDDGYSVFPKDVLLNLGATVYYRPPQPADVSRIGLYYADAEGYGLLSTTMDEGMLKGKIRNLLGDFAVRADSLPPVISNISVRVSGRRLRFTARMRDAGSGISASRIRVTLNDQLLIAEYDPYAHLVKFDEEYPLSGGTHVLRVEAGDRMGNHSSQSKTFRLNR